MNFAVFVKKNKIRYWLDSGTLLGAVRHKGFIPWDDDIDVGMLREDYDKFAKVIEHDLDENKYYYQNWLTDSKYGQPFAKLRKKNTVLIENNAANAMFESGIYIDIFAYDEYGNKLITQGFPIKILRRMILCKCSYKFWITNGTFNLKCYLIYIPIRFFALFFKNDFLKKTYEKVARKYNDNKSEKVFENGTTDYNKWAIPRECFETIVKLPFEGSEYDCPAGYDTYLKTVYGDYMKLPTKEKQINKHSFIHLKF